MVPKQSKTIGFQSDDLSHLSTMEEISYHMISLLLD